MTNRYSIVIDCLENLWYSHYWVLNSSVIITYRVLSHYRVYHINILFGIDLLLKSKYWVLTEYWKNYTMKYWVLTYYPIVFTNFIFLVFTIVNMVLNCQYDYNIKKLHQYRRHIGTVKVTATRVNMFFSSESRWKPKTQPNDSRAAVWLSFWFSTRPSADTVTN